MGQKWARRQFNHWFAGTDPEEPCLSCNHPARMHIVSLQRGKVRQIDCHSFDPQTDNRRCGCQTFLESKRHRISLG